MCVQIHMKENGRKSLQNSVKVKDEPFLNVTTFER